MCFYRQFFRHFVVAEDSAVGKKCSYSCPNLLLGLQKVSFHYVTLGLVKCSWCTVPHIMVILWHRFVVWWVIASVSNWVRRRFQPPSSPVVVFLAASDPTHSAVHCRWSCVSGDWKPPLEQSAICCHISFDARCFSEPPQNSHFSNHFPHTCCLHLHCASKKFPPLNFL